MSKHDESSGTTHDGSPESSTSDSGALDKQTRRSREETTARILDAAEELFAKRDPAKVTVREIAENAGVTHPLVHQYVGSKADILNLILERGAPQRQRIMAEHPEFREVTPLLMEDILSRRVHSRAVLRSVMDGVPYGDFEDRVRSGQMYLGLARDSLEKGRSRAVDPPAMDPEIVLAAVTALAYGWVAAEDALKKLYGVSDDKTRVREQIVEICVHLTELIYPPAEETPES